MTYLAGLIAVSVIIFTIRKYGNHIPVVSPLRNLGFFKFHYMLSGIALAFVFPDDFMPLFEPVRITVLIFCLGWIGLYYGCGLELRAHQRFSSRIIIPNIIEPLLVFIAISIIGITYIYFRIGNWSESGTALMVGLFASFTFFRRKDILYREQESAHHPVFDNLLPIGNIIPVTALAVMGRLLYQNPGITILGHGFTSIPAFFILQIIVGICGGILLNMLVSGAGSSDSISIILVGVTALMSGISTTLSFSPLFVGMITGAFLINSTLKRLETLQALNDPHEIIEKIFMFSLGTMVTPLLSILRLKLAFIIISALGLFALRAVIKYVLTTIWFSRSVRGSTESPALWIGLTGQGILAAGAVMECSFPIPQFHPVFLFFISLLIFNQIAVVLYIWFTEKNRRTEDSGNA